MNAFNVYKGKKLIDTVFYNDGITKDEVKNSLVNHDGMDSDITVCKRRYTQDMRKARIKEVLVESFDATPETLKEKVVAQIEYMRDTRRNETVKQLAVTYVEGGSILVYDEEMVEFMTEVHYKFRKSETFNVYVNLMALYISKAYHGHL